MFSKFMTFRKGLFHMFSKVIVTLHTGIFHVYSKVIVTLHKGIFHIVICQVMSL